MSEICRLFECIRQRGLTDERWTKERAVTCFAGWSRPLVSLKGRVAGARPRV
jgi:hypothetical protein